MTPRARAAASGQAMAEVALVILVFLVLLMALFDLGRAIYAYNTVSNAARAAARVAIVNQAEPPIRAEAMAQTIGMEPSLVEVDLDDLTTACGTPIQIGCPLQVTVRYRWTAITPLISNLVGPIELSSTTVMSLEHVSP